MAKQKKKMDYATLRALLEELKAILGENDEEEAEADEEEAPAKKSSKKNDGGKKSAKKSDPEPEDDEDDDSDDSDDEEEMSVQEQVEAATEDMSDKEIADFCADNGLSPKGKRAALIKRIVEAVEAGDIELDGDDEDEDEDDDEDEKPSKKSDKAQKSSKKSKKDEDEDDDDDSDDDDSDDEEEAEPTKERLAALKKFDKDTRASFKKGELERDDLVDFLCTFYNKKAKDYKKAKDSEILDLYIEASSNLISDEGEVVEEGAYTVNGVPFCCGRALDYDEDNEQYVCSVCGGEYAAGDDDE